MVERSIRKAYSPYFSYCKGFRNVHLIFPLAFRCLVDASWCEGDNANLLASGSADGFVKVWDTRSAEGRPAASLFSMTAVSHVQWRRQSNHSLASTHGGDVRLWDIRGGICKRQRT